jgi:hypothetical protein
MRSLMVLEKAADFTLWLFAHTQKLPKSVRFSLASRIENRALDLLEALQEAGVSADKAEALRQADQSLRGLVLLIRLSHGYAF